MSLNIEALREVGEQLRDAGGEALRLAADGSVLVEGPGFALLLTTGGGRADVSSMFTIAAPAQVADEPADRRLPEIPEVDKTPVAAAPPAKAPPVTRPLAPRVHEPSVLSCGAERAYHRYDVGVCLRCGARQPGEGQLAMVTTASDAAAWRAKQAPVAAIAEDGKCGRCGGLVGDREDEYGDKVAVCITCGWRPAREPTEREKGETSSGLDPFTGKLRRREPSHAGARV